jgi:hypothetical protein
MMNVPPHPGPHDPGGVPVISETSEIFDGSLPRVVMSKIWYLRSFPVSPSVSTSELRMR